MNLFNVVPSIFPSKRSKALYTIAGTVSPFFGYDARSIDSVEPWHESQSTEEVGIFREPATISTRDKSKG
jgi:hypothetical protein